MGVSVDSGGGKGKKSVTADLNLVPYIDLLTCMVSFLLITAVWTQLARLEVQQKGQASEGLEDPPDTPTAQITVFVSEAGYTLAVDAEQESIPKQGDDYDNDLLLGKLKELKETYADKNDIKIASEDEIVFSILVQAMDTALEAEFSAVSLLDAAAAGI